MIAACAGVRAMGVSSPGRVTSRKSCENGPCRRWVALRPTGIWTQAERGGQGNEGGRDARQEDSVRRRGGHDDGLGLADVSWPGGQQDPQDHHVPYLLPEEDPAALGGGADIADLPDPAGYDHPRRLTGQTQGLRHAPPQPIAVRSEAQSVFRRKADQPAISTVPGACGENAHGANLAVRAENHVGGGERHRPELPQLVEAFAFDGTDQRWRNGGSPLLDAGGQQFQKVHRASCCGLKRGAGR